MWLNIYQNICQILNIKKCEKSRDDWPFFEEDQEALTIKYENIRIISILGATNYITPYLIQEFLEIPNLGKSQGIIFRLYDNLGQNEQKYKIMEDVANFCNSLNSYGKRDIVDIVTFEKEAIDGCDLVIHIEDFRQRPEEDENLWLERCFARMNYLADLINSCMNRKLRIILNNHGPICFLATCLVEFCTTISPSNIIAITSSEGLSYINVVSEKTGVPVSRITAPAVWGFVGLNLFVDVRNIVFKADVYRPNQR
ncbi:hypothetical protein NQ314_008419 [Rhamnusium bicolor]|uniref:Uncharacterized protein n=1 Tax=Rhamnusium bicolor TaxID=1586634 RepID=A0AAV8YA63_9CUCU|nr:hypothetical protein NQ314_008419 [Rhamnusium bicolor]